MSVTLLSFGVIIAVLRKNRLGKVNDSAQTLSEDALQPDSRFVKKDEQGADLPFSLSVNFADVEGGKVIELIVQW